VVVDYQDRSGWIHLCSVAFPQAPDIRAGPEPAPGPGARAGALITAGRVRLEDKPDSRRPVKSPPLGPLPPQHNTARPQLRFIPYPPGYIHVPAYRRVQRVHGGLLPARSPPGRRPDMPSRCRRAGTGPRPPRIAGSCAVLSFAEERVSERSGRQATRRAELLAAIGDLSASLAQGAGAPATANETRTPGRLFPAS
jgi:hypothetical protein